MKSRFQSTPHSPDPMWCADSPSGDHVVSSIEMNAPTHILNHDGLSESHLEVSDEFGGGSTWNIDGHRESPLLDVNGGDHMDVRVSSLCLSSPALRVSQGDSAMIMDHCDRDEEENLLTDTPDYMSDLNRGLSPPCQQSPTLKDVHPSKPFTPFPPQPFLLDSVSPSTASDPTAAYQPAVKEEESGSDESREQQSPHPPAPKVKMSLRDFVLRKKKQREEMTKNV